MKRHWILSTVKFIIVFLFALVLSVAISFFFTAYFRLVTIAHQRMMSASRNMRKRYGRPTRKILFPFKCA